MNHPESVLDPRYPALAFRKQFRGEAVPTLPKDEAPRYRFFKIGRKTFAWDRQTLSLEGFHVFPILADFQLDQVKSRVLIVISFVMLFALVAFSATVQLFVAQNTIFASSIQYQGSTPVGILPNVTFGVLINLTTQTLAFDSEPVSDVTITTRILPRTSIVVTPSTFYSVSFDLRERTINFERVGMLATPIYNASSGTTDINGLSSSSLQISTSLGGGWGIEFETHVQDQIISTVIPMVYTLIYGSSVILLTPPPKYIYVGEAIYPPPMVRVTRYNTYLKQSFPVEGIQVAIFSIDQNFLSGLHPGTFALLENALSLPTDSNGIAIFNNLTVATAVHDEIYLTFFCEENWQLWPSFQLPPIKIKSRKKIQITVIERPAPSVDEGSYFRSSVSLSDGDGIPIEGQKVLALISATAGVAFSPVSLFSPFPSAKDLINIVSITNNLGVATFENISFSTWGLAETTYEIVFVSNNFFSSAVPIFVKSRVAKISLTFLDGILPPLSIYPWGQTETGIRVSVRITDANGAGVQGKYVVVKPSDILIINGREERGGREVITVEGFIGSTPVSNTEGYSLIQFKVISLSNFSFPAGTLGEISAEVDSLLSPPVSVKLNPFGNLSHPVCASLGDDDKYEPCECYSETCKRLDSMITPTLIAVLPHLENALLATLPVPKTFGVFLAVLTASGTPYDLGSIFSDSEAIRYKMLMINPQQTTTEKTTFTIENLQNLIYNSDAPYILTNTICFPKSDGTCLLTTTLLDGPSGPLSAIIVPQFKVNFSATLTGIPPGFESYYTPTSYASTFFTRQPPDFRDFRPYEIMQHSINNGQPVSTLQSEGVFLSVINDVTLVSLVSSQTNPTDLSINATFKITGIDGEGLADKNISCFISNYCGTHLRVPLGSEYLQFSLGQSDFHGSMANNLKIRISDFYGDVGGSCFLPSGAPPYYKLCQRGRVEYGLSNTILSYASASMPGSLNIRDQELTSLLSAPDASPVPPPDLYSNLRVDNEIFGLRFTTRSDAEGYVSVSNLRVDDRWPGTYDIVCQSGGISAGDHLSVEIPNKVSSIQLVDPDWSPCSSSPCQAEIGIEFAVQPTVRVLDANGLPLQGYKILCTVDVPYTFSEIANVTSPKYHFGAVRAFQTVIKGAGGFRLPIVTEAVSEESDANGLAKFNGLHFYSGQTDSCYKLSFVFLPNIEFNLGGIRSNVTKCISVVNPYKCAVVSRPPATVALNTKYESGYEPSVRVTLASSPPLSPLQTSTVSNVFAQAVEISSGAYPLVLYSSVRFDGGFSLPDSNGFAPFPDLTFVQAYQLKPFTLAFHVRGQLCTTRNQISTFPISFSSQVQKLELDSPLYMSVEVGEVMPTIRVRAWGIGKTYAVPGVSVTATIGGDSSGLAIISSLSSSPSAVSGGDGWANFSLIFTQGPPAFYLLHFTVDQVQTETPILINLNNNVKNVSIILQPSVDRVIELNAPLPPITVGVYNQEGGGEGGLIVKAGIFENSAVISPADFPGTMPSCVTDDQGKCSFLNLIFSSAPGAKDGEIYFIVFMCQGIVSPKSLPITVKNQYESNSSGLSNYGGTLYRLVLYFIPVFAFTHSKAGVGVSIASSVGIGFIIFEIYSYVKIYSQNENKDARVTLFVAITLLSFVVFVFWFLFVVFIALKRLYVEKKFGGEAATKMEPKNFSEERKESEERHVERLLRPSSILDQFRVELWEALEAPVSTAWAVTEKIGKSFNVFGKPQRLNSAVVPPAGENSNKTTRAHRGIEFIRWQLALRSRTDDLHLPFELSDSFRFPTRILVAVALSIFLSILSAALAVLLAERVNTFLSGLRQEYILSVGRIISTASLLSSNVVSPSLSNTTKSIYSAFAPVAASALPATLATLDSSALTESEVTSTVGKISEVVNRLSNFDYLSWLNASIGIFIELQKVVRVAGIIASVISCVCVNLLWLPMLSRYRKNVMKLRQGKYFFDRKMFPRTNAVRYIGYQTLLTLCGFFIGFFILWLAGVAVGIICVYPDLLRRSWNLIKYFIIAIFTAAFIGTLSARLVANVFLLREGVVIHRRLFACYDGAMVIVTLASGIVAIFLRFAIALGGVFSAIYRADMPVLPESLEFLDPGYSSYIGTLLTDHYASNPVKQVFLTLMLSHLSSLRALDRQRCQEPSDLELSTVDSLSGGVRRLRARNKWYLAYTLLRNPSLIPLRAKSIVPLTKQIRDKIEKRRSTRSVGENL